MTALDRDLIEHAQQAAPEPDAEAVFSLRAWARAYLFKIGEFGLHEAVDVLQASAEQYGLVDRIGQDAVQRIMVEAFAAVRPELARRDHVPVPLPDPEPHDVARSTLDAAEYLVRENDPKRFKTFLLQHSTAERDAIIAHIDKCRGRSCP